MNGSSVRSISFEEWHATPSNGLPSTLAKLDRAEEAVDVLNRRIAMDPACEPPTGTSWSSSSESAAARTRYGSISS